MGCSHGLEHLWGFLSMCFDISTIDIRVSTRVRGLHLVFLFFFGFSCEYCGLVIKWIEHLNQVKLRWTTSWGSLNRSSLIKEQHQAQCSMFFLVKLRWSSVNIRMSQMCLCGLFSVVSRQWLKATVNTMLSCSASTREPESLDLLPTLFPSRHMHNVLQNKGILADLWISQSPTQSSQHDSGCHACSVNGTAHWEKHGTNSIEGIK